VDIVLTEIGGTVGDIESLPFLEAIRQLRQEIGRDNGLFVHVTLVPFLKAAEELKTKPSQQSVGILRSIGIFPDLLVCRCEQPLTEEHRHKLALFCNVDPELVIEARDVAHSIYEVPLELARQDMDVYVLEKLRMHVHELDVTDWKQMLNKLIRPSDGEVEIAVVGKYIGLRDAYKSIYEALTHGAGANDVKIRIRMVESEDLEEKGASAVLDGVQGVLVPGGFGNRGIEGKILAVQYARERKLPYFGICLGMQCAVMEFGRNVCGLKDANSTEFNEKTPNPVIDLMEGQKGKDKGGTMRLGSKPCAIRAGTLAERIYGRREINERHRHRYEFNNEFRANFEKSGLVLCGTSPDNALVEMVELPTHPWFLACQFHPEFQSTPLEPHPLFASFIAAACQQRKS